MFIPLAFTLNHPRACIAAGVLQEHGIFAEVWDDRSAFYGPATCGGYRLMVEERDASVAAAILNSSVPPVDLDAGAALAFPPRLSLDLSIGQGVLTGAWSLPLFVAMVFLLVRLMLVVSQPGAVTGPLFGTMGFSSWLSLAILGAILGAIAGCIAWLVAGYKRDHPAGQLFVGLVIICLLAASVFSAM
jgi:hypothetical protein